MNRSRFIQLRSSSCLRLAAAALATWVVALLAVAADEVKVDPLQPIGELSGPFAKGLDFSRFNKKEGFFDPREQGEILHFFDDFLEAQGISPSVSGTDLETIYRILKSEVSLTRAAEARIDDRYSRLDEEIEAIEEAFEDLRYGKEEEEKKDKKDKKGEKDKDDGKKEDKKTVVADLDRLLQLKAEIEPLREERKLLRSFLWQEEPALARVEEARARPEREGGRIEACQFAVHTIYSVFADKVMADHGDKDFPLGLRSGLQLGNHFLGRPQINSVPYHGPRTREKPVGRKTAEKEATNLWSQGHFLSSAELAGLSPAAIGQLDVSPDNPMWHTRAHMESRRPDIWSNVENYIASRTTAELMDKKKFRKAHPDFSYDLNRARRVLFWDGIKTTSTSPKADTVDAFGQEWKLKWGDEAVVEPFGNRLRARLGAKFCDLTYVDVGGDSHLLILPGKEDREQNPDKVMPLTVEELIEAMTNSTYVFNIRPFIRDSGIVTAANAGAVLRHLPPEGKKAYRRENLIGRVWVSFRESMVEAKHDVVNLGGPVALFSDVTHGDRALRQAFLLSLWMEDKDNKEANFRAAWLPDFAGKPGSQYIEYFHDPGFSFGGLTRGAELNSLSVGDQPRGFLWLNPARNLILGSSFQIYRPEIWSSVTYSDHLAGAMHIVRLSRADIADAVSYSCMPDFWRETLVWRLTNRRDVIAKLFNLPLPDAAGPAPTITIPLTSRKDRAAAAARYEVPLKEIEADLARTGFLSPENLAADTNEPFLDRVVKEGVIQPTDETILIGILRDFRHPSGLVERTSRLDHGEPYVSLRFKGRG
ncbi:MAG TPA: hypothetical protein PK529_01785 [Verrucomicrobiales bacterium]|nr:hypothetical protein [Verrucomicrobiales bacterium]